MGGRGAGEGAGSTLWEEVRGGNPDGGARAGVGCRPRAVARPRGCEARLRCRAVARPAGGCLVGNVAGGRGRGKGGGAVKEKAAERDGKGFKGVGMKEHWDWKGLAGSTLRPPPRGGGAGNWFPLSLCLSLPMKDPCCVLLSFSHTGVVDGFVKHPGWRGCPLIENCENWLETTRISFEGI